MSYMTMERPHHRPIIVCHDQDPTTSISSARAVLEAARDGDVQALRSLPTGDLVKSAVCATGCRAPHWAAGNNQVGVLRFLIGDGKVKNEEDGQEEDGPQSVTKTALFHADDRATGPSRGRTPLHYACRNGCLEAAQLLIEQYGADANARAKQGVTPFQMAVWRNHIDVARYLVERHHVDPRQINDFHCNAAHWACICPVECAGNDGERLIPLLEWIKDTCGSDLFRHQQRQGHTAFHKACWLGHLKVVMWLHETCDAWDDKPDFAGNYGVDLCRMAGTARHQRLELYLRAHCSRQTFQWCRTLGLDYTVYLSMRTHDEETGESVESVGTESDDKQIRIQTKVCKVLRSAYLEQVRHVHPDAIRGSRVARTDEKEFHRVRDAYQNLLQGGLGTQGNPNHRLPLLLRDKPELIESSCPIQVNDLSGEPPTTSTTTGTNNELDIVVTERPLSSSAAEQSSFKARLLVVLREYGDKGMNVSNLKKKWKQVWNEPFPDIEHSGVTLSRYVSLQAGDVVTVHKNSKTGQVHVRARRQVH